MLYDFRATVSSLDPTTNKTVVVTGQADAYSDESAIIETVKELGRTLNLGVERVVKIVVEEAP